MITTRQPFSDGSLRSSLLFKFFAQQTRCIKDSTVKPKCSVLRHPSSCLLKEIYTTRVENHYLLWNAQKGKVEETNYPVRVALCLPYLRKALLSRTTVFKTCRCLLKGRRKAHVVLRLLVKWKAEKNEWVSRRKTSDEKGETGKM